MVWKKTLGSKQTTNIFLLFLILILLAFFFNAFSFRDYITGEKETDIPSSLGINSINIEGGYYSDCYDLCQDYDYASGYNAITGTSSSCRDGESFATALQTAKDLYCCCVPKLISEEEDDLHSNNCVDSDGGIDIYTPGFATYQLNGYYDECLVGSAVKEYYCTNGIVYSENYACDYGQVCVQTRSGGYCEDSTPSWNVGDTVFSGSGTGVVSGSNVNLASLDLNDYGFIADGNCRLGVQLQTNWNYANEFCQGMQGMEGITWKMYDSNGLEYSRTDIVPTGMGVDLYPEAHIWNWDGQTEWKATAETILKLPDCVIDYEYDVKLYIYDC